MPQLLSEACERFIHRVAPRHHADADAPGTWSALRRWAAKSRLGSDSLPVFDGGLDHTIFTVRSTALAMRAWHDALHLQFNKDFSVEGELYLARAQRAILRANGFLLKDRSLIYLDTAAQTLYYERHKKYVVRQRDFVLAAWNWWDTETAQLDDEALREWEGLDQEW